jgi:hypothetical protein
MPDTGPSPRLLSLLSRLSDGLLTPAEAAELDLTLRRDPAAREHYRGHVAVHLALADLAEDGKTLPFPQGPRVPKWPAFAAAAALVLAGGAAWWSLRDRPDGPAPVAGQEVPGDPVLAVISAATDLRWNRSGPAVPGQPLGPGPVRIHHGTLSFSLVGGQSVHLQGPAEFELLEHGEFVLRRGPAAFRTIGSKGPFVVHLPKGALVDMGSEFSVEAADDGTAEVRVFAKELTASTVGRSGRTLEEQQLQAGASILLNARLSPANRPASSFLRVPPAPLMVPPGGEQAYAAAVLASDPAAYWRFETAGPDRQVPDETGRHPLQLMGRARLSGHERQRFLVVNESDAAGFATPPGGIPGLDTARGITVECLIFSSAENHGTAIALERAEPGPVPPDTPPSIRHAPQTFVLERMARRGEHIGHVHPDFALRAMFRAPAGYVGGTNLYSRESHLLHRWIHVAAVHDGTAIRLFVDGRLSDSTASSLPFQNASLRPIIGRLQPTSMDQIRQWIGGIDEVALYPRALPESEIRRHAEALKP